MELIKMLFSVWREEQGHKGVSELENDMLLQGASQKEIDQAWDDIVEGFFLMCDCMEVEAEFDE